MFDITFKSCFDFANILQRIYIYSIFIIDVWIYLTNKRHTHRKNKWILYSYLYCVDVCITSKRFLHSSPHHHDRLVQNTRNSQARSQNSTHCSLYDAISNAVQNKTWRLCNFAGEKESEVTTRASRRKQQVI